jgi:hypothetical protein
VGEVILHELFIDANGSDEVGGEWVELFNRSARTIDLAGAELVSPTGARVVIPDGTELDAGAVLVIGSEGARSVVDVEVSFLSFNLPNAGGEIRLEAEGTLIDAVDIDASWGITPGVALSLRETARTAAANDAATSWCTSSAVYGSSGERGTPQQVAPSCAD